MPIATSAAPSPSLAALAAEVAVLRIEVARLAALIEAKPSTAVRDLRKRIKELGLQLGWPDAGRRNLLDGGILTLIADLLADPETGKGPSESTIRRHLVASLGEPRSQAWPEAQRRTAGAAAAHLRHDRA